MSRLAAMLSRLRSALPAPRSALARRHLFLEPLEGRSLLAAVTWDGGGGGDFDWNNATNWSGDALPAVVDDVTIDIAGTPTISHASGAATIKSLASNESIDWSGGSLTLMSPSTIQGRFVNGGAVNVQSDVTFLNLGKNAGFVTTGDFSGAAGTQLFLFYGDLDSSVDIQGDRVGLGDCAMAGAYSATTSTHFVNVNFTGTAGNIGNFKAGGQVDLSAQNTSPLSVGTLDFGGTGNQGEPAVLTGTSDIVASGAFHWTNGTVSGTGDLTANGGMLIDSLSQLNTKFIDGRTMNNAGAAVWQNGYIVAFNGAVINNLPGATFEARSGYDLIYGYTPANWGGQGDRATFNNAGTFSKTGDTAPFPYEFVPGTGLDLVFINSGQVDAQTGTLEFSDLGRGSGFNTTGDFAGASGTLLRLFNGQLASSVSIQGDSVGLGDCTMAGAYNVTGSTQFVNVTFTGTAASTGELHASGIFDLSPAPGAILPTQDFTFSGGGNHGEPLLSVALGGSTPGILPNNYDQLDVTGEVTLAAGLAVSLANGFTPTLNQTFVIVNNDDADPVSGMFAGLPEGATVAASGGWEFKVSYQAGDGNDISLRCVTVPVQQVAIDIQPDSLNVDSNGTLTVLVYGAADFNASLINVSTVHFAGASAWQSTLVDANHDGRLDLQLKFRRQDTILDDIYAQLLIDDHDADGILDSTRQTAEIELTGELVDHALFSGSDSITLFLAGKSLRNLLNTLFG